MSASKSPIVVLISGSGSNLQALIDAQQRPDYPAEIKAVISNVAAVKGLARAEQAGIPTHVISHKNYPDRQSFDREIAKLIDRYSPELVILAGFMRILSDWFVDRYEGRLLNIHPSLLPKYKGLDTHRQAIEAGDRFHGATVHYVTRELDGGPLILQAKVAVQENDTDTQLAARVLEKEHLIYPKVVEWATSKKLRLENGNVILNGKELQHPVLLENL